jgi:hypothetical protein
MTSEEFVTSMSQIQESFVKGSSKNMTFLGKAFTGSSEAKIAQLVMKMDPGTEFFNYSFRMWPQRSPLSLNT